MHDCVLLSLIFVEYLFKIMTQELFEKPAPALHVSARCMTGIQEMISDINFQMLILISLCGKIVNVTNTESFVHLNALQPPL